MAATHWSGGPATGQGGAGPGQSCSSGPSNHRGCSAAAAGGQAAACSSDDCDCLECSFDTDPVAGFGKDCIRWRRCWQERGSVADAVAGLVLFGTFVVRALALSEASPVLQIALA